MKDSVNEAKNPSIPSEGIVETDELNVAPPLDAFDIARSELGMFGAMLSGSKIGYETSHLNHKAVFNANVVSETHGKIWYGDLDLARERDTAALQRIANRLGAKIYVLREMDGRFEYEEKPRISAAVATYLPNQDTNTDALVRLTA